MICNQFQVFLTQEHYVLQCLDGNNSLFINRYSTRVSLGELPKDSLLISPTQYCGIVGFVTLLAGTYLILIKDKRTEGLIDSQEIFSISSIDIYRITYRVQELNSAEKRYETQYLSKIQSILESGRMYFSYSYDITNNLQSVNSLNSDLETKKLPLWKRAKSQFFFNEEMVAPFIKAEAHNWILPLMFGHIHIISFSMDEIHSHMILIARKVLHQGGTILIDLGCDEKGDCSNFVEVEQIILVQNYLFSFSQVFASIPISWSDNQRVRPNQGKPKWRSRLGSVIIYGDTEHHKQTMKSHFEKLKEDYENVHVIDLLSSKFGEGELQSIYQSLLKSEFPEIQYTHMEFQKDGPNSFDDLLTELKESFRNFGYFCRSPKKEVISIQRGVFRVNCYDCGQRTTTCQSYISKAIISLHFTYLKILQEGYLLPDSTFISWHKEWEEFGNVLSLCNFETVPEDCVLKDVHYESLVLYYMLGYQKVTDKHGERSQKILPPISSEVLKCSILALPSDEDLAGGWILTSINQREQEQQRIVLVTQKAYYRVKYNFKIGKIEHMTRIKLKDILFLQKGYFKKQKKTLQNRETITNQYGLKIYTELEIDTEMKINFSQEDIDKLALDEQVRRYKAQENLEFANEDKEFITEIALCFQKQYYEAVKKKLVILEDHIESKNIPPLINDHVN